MTNNGYMYIDASVQKGSVSGFPGWLEHTSAIIQLIREARIYPGYITSVWLDLVSAHPICSALTHHESTPTLLCTLQNQGNHQRSFWQRISQIHFKIVYKGIEEARRGITTGWTISAILFVMGMNLFSAERETQGQKTSTVIRLPRTV